MEMSQAEDNANESPDHSIMRATTDAGGVGRTPLPGGDVGATPLPGGQQTRVTSDLLDSPRPSTNASTTPQLFTSQEIERQVNARGSVVYSE